MTAPATLYPFAPDAPVTKAGTPLVKLAFSRAKRAGLFANVESVTGFKVKPDLRANASQTGSWTFESVRGRHVIALDPNAHKGVSRAAPRYTAQRWFLGCFAAILRHEAHHALHTERDLAKVDRACKAHGVPFVSLNVGEDIRIDAIAAKAHGFYNWSRWYGSVRPVKTDEPLAWLVWTKIYEMPHIGPVTWTGDKEVERIRIGKPDGKGKRPTLAVLGEFYAEFQAASDTMAVVPILRDLFLTFPSAEQDVGNVSGLPSGAVGHGYTDKASEEVAKPDDVVVIGDGNESPVELPSRHVAPEMFMTEGGRTASDERWQRISGRSLGAFLTQVRRVAERLARLMGAQGGQPERVATSGRRLHVGNVAAGRAEAFRTAGERKGTCPRVVALFDQSGSMGPDFANHGAAFLGALLMLSQQGIVDAQIVLTGGGMHSVLPQNYPLNKVWRFASNQGSESVRGTLNAQKKLVQSADVVLIYTDGNLTDGHVDAGQWRSHGVDLIGAAVVDMDSPYHVAKTRADCSRHFHRALLAPNGEELATKIAQYIASR